MSVSDTLLSLRNIVVGLLMVGITLVVFYSVISKVMDLGIITNSSTFYSDFTTNVGKVSNLVGTSIDITQVIIVVGLFLIILAYFSRQ